MNKLENEIPHVVRETTTLPTPSVVDSSSINSTKKPQPKVKEHLSFLRYENLLSPNDKNYIPPTVNQINSLASWAGVSGGGRSGKGKLAAIANVEEFLMKKWTNENKGIEDSNVIYGCVWRYLLIRLGVIEQPIYRRSEPSTVVTESYSLDDEPFVLRAKIWYSRDELAIDFFNDSLHSASRRDSKAIFSLNLEHDQSLTAGNTIHGHLRHDEFQPETNERFADAITTAIKNNRVTKNQLQYYVQFVQNRVWKALWSIHDFNSISPRDFLKCVNKDPFTLSFDEMPTHRELLSICGWAGIDTRELAYICGETTKRMRWLTSGKGDSALKKALSDFDKNKITSNQLQGIRWANTPSRHAVSMILSAFGLAPQIPVIGRTAPIQRKVRSITTKEIQGVPVEFVKIETTFMFTNALQNQIKVVGRTNTHKGAGEEWAETFDIKVSEDLDIYVDGHLSVRNGEASETWAKLNSHVPEVAHSYMEKALWHSLRNYLVFYFSK